MNWTHQLYLAFQLLNNAALLAIGVLGVCLLRGRVTHRLSPRSRSLLEGAQLAALGVLSMQAPLAVPGGPQLGLAVALFPAAILYFGIVAGVISFGLVVSYALAAGSQVATGVDPRLFSVLQAAAFVPVVAGWFLLNRAGIKPSLRHVVLLALVSTASALAAFGEIVGWPIFIGIFKAVGPAWLFVAPATMIALAAVVRHYERSKARDAALAEGERRFRKFYNETPAMLTVFDQAGRCVAVSDRWLEVMGYSREEVIGRSRYDFVAPSSASDVRDRVLPALRAAHQSIEHNLQVVRKDGAPIDVAATYVSIRDPATGAEQVLSYSIDQTARKQAERALEERESDLRAIIDNAPLAIFLKDNTGRYRLVNRRMEKWTGRAAAELLGRRDDEVLAPDFARRVLEADHEVIKHGRVNQTIRQPAQRDSPDHHILVTKFPVHNSAGQISGIAGFAVDITERIRAERSLQQRERDFTAIMDNAPFAIFLKDREGRYRLINRTYTDWFGDQPADLYDRTTAEVYTDELVRSAGPADRQVLEHGQVAVVDWTTMKAKPGIEQVQITKFPIRDDHGTIVGMAGFISDVTERKRAEKLALEAERRFRALIEHSNDMVAVIGSDGIVTYRSPSSIELTGYATQDVVGHSIFGRVHPEDLEDIKLAFRSISATPGRRASGRSRVRHIDGTWRHVAWMARNASDVPGVNGIIINSRDVTEAQRLEERLRESQKMEAVGQLAGGIAHDFNNILGAILGFSGFLVEDLPKGTAEYGFAERIMTASERGKELVQQILAFSRRSAVERKPTALATLMRETNDLLQASIPSSTQLEMQIETEELVADVNAAQISQILLNLCLNANDALQSEPGSIALSLACAEPGDPDLAILTTRAGAEGAHVAPEGERMIAGTLRPGCDYARITVADSGVGMAPEVLKHIFDPFFTTKARGRGTGLGLSVVHGVVTAYEGACVVTTHPGTGSIFRIYLPLTSASALPAIPEMQEPGPRGDERILVIDDDVSMTEMLSIGLGRLGYQVVAFNDPAVAVKVFSANPAAWAAVISDQVMPNMKGLTLFRRLKAVHPSLRFILCTGFSDGATEESAQAAGVDAFFLKPVSPQKLAGTIRRLIDDPADASRLRRIQSKV